MYVTSEYNQEEAMGSSRNCQKLYDFTAIPRATHCSDVVVDADVSNTPSPLSPSLTPQPGNPGIMVEMLLV